MPNPIKYTTGTETLALKKGNFYIGTGDVGKGPSDVTGFYQGLSPSEGGYVIYMNREGAPGDLSYHVAANDSELITFTNNLAGQSYTTVNQCLVYFAGQSNKVVLNRDYESIVTDGLVLNLDAGFTPSYPTSNTTWYDVGGTNNGTLTNGPTFSTDGGGSIVFDGADDYVNLGTPFGGLSTFTVDSWFKPTQAFLGSTANAVITTTWNSGDVNYYIGWGGYIGQNSKIAAGIYKNGWITAGGFTPVLNTWYNVSLSLGSNQLKMYVNGNIFATRSTTAIPTSIYGGIYLGKRWDTNFNGNEFFKGNIENIRIYNRALSADEVLQNYNAQKGRFGL